MFVLFATVLLIPLFLCWLHLKRVEEDAKVGVAGPKGWPLFGAIFEIKPYIKTRKIFKIFHDYHAIYGDTYQVRIGTKKMIISRDPKITESIVNNPKFEKSREYEMLKSWLGDSLEVSEGEKWNKMRKLLTPAFHFQILERFIPVFEEQVAVMIENIRKEIANPKGIDVVPKFHALTLDIISETSMGVGLNAQSGLQSPFMEANVTMIDLFEKRVYSGHLSIEWIFRLSSIYKVWKDNTAFINDFVDKLIVKRHEKLLEENNNPSNSKMKKRPALLDILLQAKLEGESLSNEDIQAEVKTFLFAGHETTVNSFLFATYLIAKHHDVQHRMWLEIKANALDVTSDHLTIRKLNSLSYMDNVIKESLRLYPAGSMIFKQCHEDVQIGHLFIPANTTVGTNIYSCHRNEKIFKNAETFNPDRFNNEVTAEDRNPYAFQPFSSGLRNCIGQKFAMLEMKTIFVKLLSNFELTLFDKDFEVDVIQAGTLKSRNGLQLKFKKRSH